MRGFPLTHAAWRGRLERGRVPVAATHCNGKRGDLGFLPPVFKRVPAYLFMAEIFLAFSSTFSASAFLNSLSLTQSFLSLKESIWAASTAAFLAPDFPMETVATGTPAGICTVERRASSPFKALESMGTPITGNVVFAAMNPARCAACPAPAMITFIPLFSAVAAISNVLSGALCAEDTVISYAVFCLKKNAARRKHGEWFELNQSDVSAFKRRKYM